MRSLYLPVFYVTLISSLIPSDSYAQCEPPYNGEFRCVWGTGNTSETGTMRNGEEVGEWKSYYHNGNRSWFRSYRNGEFHGSNKNWTIEGVLKNESEWEYGNKISEKKYDEEGILVSSGKWDSQGRKQGEHYAIYKPSEGYIEEDGLSYIRTTYSDDKIQLRRNYNAADQLMSEERFLGGNTGTWVKVYHENGQLKAEGRTVEVGLRQGKWSAYHANGKPSAYGSYLKNFEDGPWEYFNESGNLIRKVTFKYPCCDGRNFLIGISEEYYPDGRLGRRMNFNDQGLSDGEQHTYFADGQLFELLIYENGRLMELAQYDQAGNKLDNGPFKNGNGLVKIYNAQGQLVQQGIMENGVPKQ